VILKQGLLLEKQRDLLKKDWLTNENYDRDVLSLDRSIFYDVNEIIEPLKEGKCISLNELYNNHITLNISLQPVQNINVQ